MHVVNALLSARSMTRVGRSQRQGMPWGQRPKQLVTYRPKSLYYSASLTGLVQNIGGWKVGILPSQWFVSQGWERKS